MCGWTIARAHARSGDRIAIASYLGKGDVFERALADFAAAYADLNEHDYNVVVKAVRDGRITAEEGI
jgi:predicted alpha/beta hydrolase